MKDTKEIVITNNVSIKFSTRENKKYGNMLILGNFHGICGNVFWNSNTLKWDFNSDEHDGDCFTETLNNNIDVIIDTIESGSTIVIVGSGDTISYFKHLIYACIDWGFFGENTKKKRDKIFKQFRTIDTTKISEDAAIFYNNDINSYRTGLAIDRIIDFTNNKIFSQIEKMKFDTIIQNPPYSGSLHLDFLEKGLDILTENGKMVIVEPATWLINVRKNGKAKKYDAIKKRLDGHIESVVIENLNNEFDTGLYVPFATTTIDMSKTFDTIKFNCCGEEKEVKSIYDCNLIGDYKMIWSILDKVMSFGDMMKSHITKDAMGEGYWYVPYIDLCGVTPIAVSAIRPTSCNTDERYITLVNGDFYKVYANVAFHSSYEISNTIAKSMCRGGSTTNKKKYSDKNANCIYSTKEELENWKHFVFNNKLPLFINIVMTIDQHNNSKDFLPWLVDKQYTDKEINEKFGFTDKEVNLINKTIEKFERHSPWFKRYMCGQSSVSDVEVNNFMSKLEENYA